MEKRRIHTNWFMLLNLICGYIVSIFCYNTASVYGINTDSVLYSNIVQIIYLATIVIIPSALYFRIVTPYKKFKKSFLRPIKLSKIPMYIIIAVFLWCIGIFLNGIFAMMLEKAGIIPIQQLSPSDDPMSIFFGFLGVCVAAPVFEEFFFRGIILSGYSKLGKFNAIFASSLLFAIAHGSITIFVLPLIYGGVCAYIVMRTKSIYPGIIMHSVCNFISWIIFIGDAGDNVEYIINLTVASVGIIISVLAVIYILVYLHKNKESFLRNEFIFIKSIFNDLTWVGIFILYFFNNILAHMSLK